MRGENVREESLRGERECERVESLRKSVNRKLQAKQLCNKLKKKKPVKIIV